MLKYDLRTKIVTSYLKWSAEYDLSHTPETFLEYLLINNYIDERAVCKDNEQLYYADTDSTHKTIHGTARV